MQIAVLGSHPATKAQAPFGDPSWQIWACSSHNVPCESSRKQKAEPIPRIDEFFEVHVPAGDPTRPPDYLDEVRRMSERMPVWMRDRNGFPHALEYPYQEAVFRFGAFFMETSSIAFVMAKAIMAKPDAIGLWGVMQSAPNEYTYQLPGLQYFMQKAHEAGIKVVVPEESWILRPRIYQF